MSESRSWSDLLIGSTREALSIRNILMTIVRFIAFGVITAMHYIVFNLNQVGKSIETSSVPKIIISIIMALANATWQGMLIVGATLWDIGLRANDVFKGLEFGTWIYVLIFGVALLLAISQWVVLTINILDFQVGKANGFVVPMAISLIVLIVFCGVAYALKSDEIVVGAISSAVENVTNTTINDTITNTTQTATINMVG